MDKTICVQVMDKVATVSEKAVYICGNSDYVVKFAFDAEWDKTPVKTARFVPDNKRYVDIVFEGNTCGVPVLTNTKTIQVGVYAGDLHTTTPAHIQAKKSILCGFGAPAAPADDVYNQLMGVINEMLTRIEALEAGGGGGSDSDFTTSLLGSAVLGNMILGG